MEHFDWNAICEQLPPDFESSARTHKAFVRPRAIADPATLLRLVLLYAATPLSFRSVVTWAQAAGLADLSDVALIGRMQQCLPWIQHMVNQLLAQKVEPVASSRCIELLDASVLDGPQGKPWRLHLGYDPVNRRITQLRLTPQSTGETLRNFTPVIGTLYIADRGYAHLKTAKVFVAQGSQVLLRVKGTPWLEHANPDATVEHAVEGGRIIIAPIPIDKRFKSQEKLVARAKRKGQRLGSKTKLVADFVFLFCSDDTVPAQEAVALYRVRWQIELLFKRLKSLQQLNNSRLKSETLYQVEVWGQLLVSLLVERMGREKASFFPFEAVAATVCLAILAIPSSSDSASSVSLGE